MKKYRLLKELPTFKAGEIFRLEGGDLFYYPADNGTREAHWSDKIMAYHHKTLEKFPNILEEWFKEVEVEEQKYYSLSTNGRIDEYIWDNTTGDNIRKELGNYFSSIEEAGLVVRKLKAWKRLKDAGFDVSNYGYDYDTNLKIDGEIYFSIKSYDGIENDFKLLFRGEG